MTDPEEEKSSQTSAVLEIGDSKPKKHSKKKKKKKTKQKDKLSKTKSEDSVGDADVSVEVETAEEASRVVKNEPAVGDNDDEIAQPKQEKKSKKKKKKKKEKKDKRIKQEPSGSKGETSGDEKMGDSSMEDGNGVDNNEDSENDSDDELLAAAAMWAGDDDEEEEEEEEEQTPKVEPPYNEPSTSSFSKRITTSSTTPTQPQNLSLHITQLPYDSTEFDLRKLFAEQGCSITSIRLVYDHDTDGRKTVFRGVAFCDFLEASSYHKALKLHHKTSIRGRRLNIRPCKSKEELAAIVERTQNLVREKIHQQLAGDYSSGNSKNTQNSTNTKPRSSGEGSKAVSKANRTGLKRANHSSPKDRKTKKPRVDKDGKPVKLTKKERNRRAAIIMQKRRRQKK